MLIRDFPKVNVDFFFYYIPESVDYIDDVATVRREKVFIDRSSVLLDNSMFENTIAVCTQPWKESLNRLMILAALEITPKVVLYKHPRDDYSYEDLDVSEESLRYLNHKLVIMRYSSLYVDFMLAGVNVFVYDIDGIDSDILRENNRKNCFTDLTQLKEAASHCFYD
jgi:hypothetical protein